MTIKESNFEVIHNNVFLRQCKGKVYIFKMLIEGPESGMNLEKRMQLGADLQNAWLIFNLVKYVNK